MKQKSANLKTSRRTPHNVDQAPSAGSNGLAIAPPAYGIGSVDHGLTESQASSGAVTQRQADVAHSGGDAGEPVENKTGLPDNLKAGIESLSGLALDDVRVHYNSDKPAGLQALAYTQGTEIHVGPGQERHLPHEAWHVVQQAQGRVRPTMQMKDGMPVNDDQGLEYEADVMGAKAVLRYGRMHDSRSNPVFPQRQYDPQPPRGRQLLGHELSRLLQRQRTLRPWQWQPRATIQCRREIRPDPEKYADGLNPVYDAGETHFTWLEDNEIIGTAAQPWLAQPGENLHITIQDTAHAVVVHYFWREGPPPAWRVHMYGVGAVDPYGMPAHPNLTMLQAAAISWAKPPANIIYKDPNKQKQKKSRGKKQVIAWADE
jgi:hypothetical protein